jgi:hypothetical protein
MLPVPELPDLNVVIPIIASSDDPSVIYPTQVNQKILSILFQAYEFPKKKSSAIKEILYRFSP